MYYEMISLLTRKEPKPLCHNVAIIFQGIENIHKMRSSLKDLINTVTAVPGGGGASIENFMSGLANSGWLKHVKAVLDVSIAIADCILSNRSVIVHCSDGWDRTSQTCALACLMLDGYYRTIQGFQVTFICWSFKVPILSR